jgi:hypothetical protein
LQKFETTKLFYGEYLYKLTIKNQLSTEFREKNLPNARRVLDNMQQLFEDNQPLQISRGLRVSPLSKEHFSEATKLYTHFSKAQNYKLRVEQQYMNVYSNDISWLNTIIYDIGDSVNLISLHEPNPNYTLTPDTILVDKSNGYQYKVTLGNDRGDETFGLWASNNPNLIKIGPKLQQELFDNGYVSGMYFYARDDRTLQLCNLMLTNIRRIDKLVVK